MFTILPVCVCGRQSTAELPAASQWERLPERHLPLQVNFKCYEVFRRDKKNDKKILMKTLPLQELVQQVEQGFSQRLWKSSKTAQNKQHAIRRTNPNVNWSLLYLNRPSFFKLKKIAKLFYYGM